MPRRGRMVGSALLLAIGVPFVAWLALPWPIAYRWVDPEMTALMRYRIAQVERAGEPLALRHAWVPLGQISANVVRAVVAAEDGRFREHEGIDWVAVGEELRYRGEVPFSWTDPGDLRALVGAGRYYLRIRSEVRGRSTRARARPPSCSSRGGSSASSARTGSSSCT